MGTSDGEAPGTALLRRRCARERKVASHQAEHIQEPINEDTRNKENCPDHMPTLAEATELFKGGWHQLLSSKGKED